MMVPVYMYMYIYKICLISPSLEYTFKSLILTKIEDGNKDALAELLLF